MSTGDRGFASLSKQRRREMAQKGGKAATASGKAYKWTKTNAATMGRKGAQAKKKKAAELAAQWIMGALGYTPQQLITLKMSVDEFIYYGGSHTTNKRIAELAERINATTSPITETALSTNSEYY